MVRKNRINIILLAIFHIALLINPIVLKSVHKHVSPIQQNFNQQFPSFNKHHEECLICQFEFVNFIAETPLKVTPIISSSKVNYPLTTSQVVPTAFSYFQHRAPPEWVI